MLAVTEWKIILPLFCQALWHTELCVLLKTCGLSCEKLMVSYHVILYLGDSGDSGARLFIWDVT